MIMIHVYSKSMDMVASKVFTTDIHQERMQKSLILLQKGLTETANDTRLSVFDDERNLLLESHQPRRGVVGWISSDPELQATMTRLWSSR